MEVITNYLLITHYALRIMHYLKISQGYFNKNYALFKNIPGIF